MGGVLKIMHKLRGLTLVRVYEGDEQGKYDALWWKLVVWCIWRIAPC